MPKTNLQRERWSSCRAGWFGGWMTIRSALQKNSRLGLGSPIPQVIVCF